MKALGPLLSALLASQAATAAPTVVRLDGIRAVGPAGGASEIKYKVEVGPGAKQRPGSLTQEQIDSIDAFLVPDVRRPPAGLSDDYIARMQDALIQVDKSFKRSIPREEWDRRIGEMKREFTARHGRPGESAKTPQQWEDAIDEAIVGVVEKLGDRYTYYMDREQTRDYLNRREGLASGIGAATRQVEDAIELFVVPPGSPAARAGLVEGDVITAVDGVPTRGRKFGEVARSLRGAAGSRVSLRSARLNRDVVVTRAEYETPNIFGKMAAPGIGYVYMSAFEAESDKALFAQIDRLKAAGAKKLILDLRENGGGAMSAAESIISEFVDDDELLTVVKRGGRVSHTFISDGDGRYHRMPLAILINGDSASASEVVASSLREHGKAVIVGSTSFGKGSFQSNIDLQVPAGRELGRVRSDGTSVHVTEGTWHTPMGRSVEGLYDPSRGDIVPGTKGVRPDVAVETSDAETEAVRESLFRQLYGRPAPGVHDAALDAAIGAFSSR